MTDYVVYILDGRGMLESSDHPCIVFSSDQLMGRSSNMFYNAAAATNSQYTLHSVRRAYRESTCLALSGPKKTLLRHASP